MRVLVDTPVWSQALRRRASRAGDALVAELAALINDGRVALIGPVRQELLSGIKEHAQYVRLRDHLRAFPDLEVVSSDYEDAASLFNKCREKGIQGSNTAFLICAVAFRTEFPIFTVDDDFTHFSTVLPIRLHHAAGRGA